jgi:alkylation response protein AidB-like acyl-CoA dehydrogenase
MIAARQLLPLVESCADEAERLRRQSDTVVAAFRKAGLYRMLLPRSLGGAELSFVDAMEVVEQVSWADGSAGWCTMVGNVAGSTVGAYLPDQGAQQVYGKGPDVMVAGQGVPRGQARRVDGGFVIRGEWSYGSGIYHAEVIHSGCTVMDGDKPERNADGVPEVILAHFDPKEIELRDNWNVLGLRGTGSYDYALKSPELFVPDSMCYRYAANVPVRGGNQYSVGLIGFTSWGHTAWALGVGRRVLDEIAKLARSKGNVFGALGAGASFKHAFGNAEIQYRAARSLCYQVWTDLSETLLRGEPASLEQIALVRMAMRHIHDVVSEISTFAHRAGGGVSLRPSVLQRCYRDVHGGTQHVLLSDQIFQECSRVLLGMTGKNARWSIFGVLD